MKNRFFNCTTWKISLFLALTMIVAEDLFAQSGQIINIRGGIDAEGDGADGPDSNNDGIIDAYYFLPTPFFAGNKITLTFQNTGTEETDYIVKIIEDPPGWNIAPSGGILSNSVDVPDVPQGATRTLELLVDSPSSNSDVQVVFALLYDGFISNTELYRVRATFRVDVNPPSSFLTLLSLKTGSLLSQTSNEKSFAIDMSQSSDAIGGYAAQSGNLKFDVQVSVNKGQWGPLKIGDLTLTETKMNRVNFTGEYGNTYSFRVRAIDGAGNKEEFPEDSDATRIATVTLVRSATLVENTVISGRLTLADSPYVLSGRVIIPQNEVLTIEPGVVIKFKSGRIDRYDVNGNHVETLHSTLIVNGALNAVGTRTAPIHFTSYHDDSIGGDTDTDGGTVLPSRGDWGYILFRGEASEAIKAQNRLEYCVIRYGGRSNYGEDFILHGGALISCRNVSVPIANCEVSYSYEDGIEVLEGARVTITNCKIDNNGVNGIDLTSQEYIGAGKALTIANSQITNNGAIGIVGGGNDASLTITNNVIDGNVRQAITNTDINDIARINDNTITNNGANIIETVGGVVNSSVTLKNSNGPGIPFAISNFITIPVNVTLTIEAGNILKFNGSGIIVNGILNAKGTEENQIYFTSYLDDSIGGDSNLDESSSIPSPQNWMNLSFVESPEEFSEVSSLEYSVIRYAGRYSSYYSYNDAAISCSGVSVNFANCEIEFNYRGFDLFNGANSTIRNCKITNNTSGALIRNSSPIINSNLISNNSEYGITVYYSEYTYTKDVNAENNDWGDPSGPLDSSDDRHNGGLFNPGGKGVVVSDKVDYQPFVGSNRSVATISGQIEYYNKEAFVSDAEVLLQGATSKTITAYSGYYVFDDLARGDYRVTPMKSGDVGYAIRICQETTD